MDRPGPVGTAHAVVLGLGAVHVGARLLGARRTAVATKPLIGPALAALAAVSVRGTRRPSPWLVGALAASTAGDVALMGTSRRAWTAGVGSFLVAQGCYTRHLAELGAARALRRRPVPALAFGTAWALTNAVLGPRTGALRRPLLVYSAALAATGASSNALGGRLAVGGWAFVASDLLIGLDLAGVEVPARDAAVMATYVTAQYLLVTGALERARPA